MQLAEKKKFRILIADDDIKQGEEIRNMIDQTTELFPGSMGVSRSQLEIKVISKVAEVDSELVNISQSKSVPYNIILADIFMPLNKDSQEPSIEGGWLKFYRAISDLPDYDPEIVSELLLIAITNKTEDAVEIKRLIRKENQACLSPWVDFLHKPNRPVFKESSKKPELLDENSWANIIKTAIKKYKDKCWRNTFIECDLDTLLPVSSVLSDIRGKVLEFNNKRIILLVGEDGTEKEKIAQYVHQQKLTTKEEIEKRKYIRLHCDSVAIDKIKAGFLGIEKGTPIDNHMHIQPKTEAGLLEKSHNGTIFFDGVDTDPQKTCALDVVLSELINNNWSYQRIGGTMNFSFRGTLILGTSSLSNLYYSGNREKAGFSRELFHKIEADTIEIPPLRERHADILPLATKFLNMDKHQDDPFRELGECAKKWLLEHDWSGNISELEGLMKKVSLRTKLNTTVNVEIIKECLPSKKVTSGSNKSKASSKMQKWDCPGDACFVINTKNRIHFHHKGKLRDLSLKRYSRAETLITSLANGTLYGDDIKNLMKNHATDLNPESEEKPSSIVRAINTALNDKIAALGFPGVPKNIAFIYFNRKHNHYELTIPIKAGQDLNSL